VNKVEFILLSDSYDFTTDYIAIELEKRGKNYLRIDRDLLSSDDFFWDFNNKRIKIRKGGKLFNVQTDQINGVYYRAPTYLRETFSRSNTPEKQLQKSQWMALFRNLMCIEDAVWINNPTSTFHAENKLIQLKIADQIDFDLPETFILNSASELPINDEYIIKSLDTAIFSFGDQEGFVYTNKTSYSELSVSNLSHAPVVIQKDLSPKIDLRVTVVGQDLYAVKILKGDDGVDGDWRKLKDDVSFVPVRLPVDVKEKCIKLVRSLNLLYGAIDLVLYKKKYYFIEVNPTGEWAWLVDSANQHIYKSICNYLEG
jgi:glutathione synthase/RimK-type ligase-like ATP-grasp enzyme